MKLPVKFTVYDKIKMRANRYKILASVLEDYLKDLEAAGVNFEFMTKLDEHMVLSQAEQRIQTQDENIAAVIAHEVSCEEEVPTVVYAT